MESLGEYLTPTKRTERPELKDLSNKTKIGINYLRYIEENKFDKIPGMSL